jgi:hypothetical protein
VLNVHIVKASPISRKMLDPVRFLIHYWNTISSDLNRKLFLVSTSLLYLKHEIQWQNNFCPYIRFICVKGSFNLKTYYAIPVTVRGGPQDCERFPHFVDNRLTDGGEAASLMRRQAALYPQEDSWYSFLLEAELTPGP